MARAVSSWGVLSRLRWDSSKIISWIAVSNDGSGFDVVERPTQLHIQVEEPWELEWDGDDHN